MRVNRICKLLFAIVLGSICLTSCTSQRNLIYLQGKDMKETKNGVQTYTYREGESNSSPDYKIQAGDMVYVNIFSTIDEEASRLFGSNSSSPTNSLQYQSDQNIFLSSYEVDKVGNITLPVIGMLHVGDMTIEEIQNLIKEKAEEYSKDIIVVCKLVTFKIRVAGEVNRPGVYTFYQPSVDIFDALMTAGDLTYDASRKKVRVIRKTDKEDIIYTLDIRKASVLRDKNYYLRPGDIVYVEPNKHTKNLTAVNRPLSTVSYALSIVSAVCSVVAIIMALK